jgi:uroporphyrinogen-III synthase
MLQNRINILCTRNIDKAFIQDASARNIALDVIPFIKTEPALTSEILKEVQKKLIQTEAVIFTSSNAVEALMTGLDTQSGNLFDRTVFCIGYATKRSVVKYFGEKSIVAVADNAKELAKVVRDANVKNVIFFCGDQRRDELPALLREDNIKIKEIVVYRTITTPKKIENKYDGIFFFSPSAVNSFFENNILDDQTVLFAIGSTTADEIKNLSKNKVVVSDVPDKKSLMDKAVSYFQANPIHY